MVSLTALSCRFSWVSLNICSNVISGTETSVRGYARRPKPPCTNAPNPPCRRAYDDLPTPVDPNCLNQVVKSRPKEKKGILHYIKLKMVQGGTNFGTPFRRLDCKPCKEEKEEETKAVLVKSKEPRELNFLPYPGKRAGLQISVLGADTAVGHYVSLLLKQCLYMKKLRLYETQGTGCPRSLNIVVEDLKNINTNCLVQAFRNANNELETCLQNSDIVLMLDTATVSPDMPFETRFAKQAPIVQAYAEAICTECPNAFIIVCTSPIDCMVPIVAQTLKSTGMYNPAKVLGSLAVPEMRASTLAARALGLEPRYIKVPCIGGTEGETLVPLFSRAVDYFEFCEKSAETMTKCVRTADKDIMRCDCGFRRMAVLSEAHALTSLVTKVAHALLCLDMPRVTGFVETNASQLVTPANYLATEVFLNGTGMFHRLDFPRHMNETEMYLMESCLASLVQNVTMGNNWFKQTRADKLLNKLEENEPELATSPEEECVICVNAKATMQTSPCGHRVVCRRCFVKTIQMAVSQRLLPLRCVICRAKILRLRQAPRLVTSKSWQVSSGSGKSWGVPGSVSSYSVGARSVPASASLYSVTSGESSLSGVSSVSSNSGGVSGGCSTKLCGGAKCGGACLGAVPRAPAPPRARQPASNSLRRSQHHSMKARLQDYQVHSYTGGPTPAGEPSGRLPPIREFQREFREGRRESAAASASTRIRCAQKIVTQLETSPQKNKDHFFRPLKAASKDDPPKSPDQSKETDRKKDNPKAKPKKEDKKKKEDATTNPEDKKKDESSDNRKNEIAERKKEEKLRLKAEKEAKKEAKQQAKEEERQAKLLAKEEERQAKLLAKEEKKKAKKEAKLAAQAEKEKIK